MLGEAGATVYCTGRSSRAEPGRSPRAAEGRLETIEDTAELVTTAGGNGIAVRVDHAQEAEVALLFDRVAREQGRLDVLANVITGQPASWKSFLDEAPAASRAFVESWIWPHVTTAWHAARLMVTGGGGLIVELIEQHGIGYHGAFGLDMMETLLKREVFALAHELAVHGVTTVAIEPGFMRTEAILEQFGVTEANWRDGIPKGQAWGWGGSETPQFVGRAVAALAADPRVARWNGHLCTAWDLSQQYGFTDIDDRLPDRDVLIAAQGKAKTTFLAGMTAAAHSVSVDWEVRSKSADG